MRKYIVIFTALVLGLATMPSCDHVDNPFPTYNTDLDTTLYPGVWSTYIATEWPDFSTIPDDNPNRNAVIEDFTGHRCAGCPAAATVAHNLHEANPSRVFTAGIHAGPTISGITAFQEISLPTYPYNFMNTNGLEFGSFFGVTIAGSGFNGNPAGSVSRKTFGTEYFYATSNWSQKVSEVLASPRRVQVKAKVNYFPATKGLFLHTEIEKEDASLNYEDLGIMVYVIEDSLIGPQLVGSVTTLDYVHRDIMRGTISGQTWGRDVIDGEFMDNKYYLDYSYLVPNQSAPSGQTGTHNAENMHLLINIYDKNTYEIIQVIKKKIVE